MNFHEWWSGDKEHDLRSPEAFKVCWDAATAAENAACAAIADEEDGEDCPTARAIRARGLPPGITADGKGPGDVSYEPPKDDDGNQYGVIHRMPPTQGGEPPWAQDMRDAELGVLVRRMPTDMSICHSHQGRWFVCEVMGTWNPQYYDTPEAALKAALETKNG